MGLNDSVQQVYCDTRCVRRLGLHALLVVEKILRLYAFAKADYPKPLVHLTSLINVINNPYTRLHNAYVYSCFNLCAVSLPYLMNTDYLDQIKKYLEQIAPISDADWDFFTSRLTLRTIPKKTVFLKCGQVENHISFVVSGVIRLFIPNDDPDKDLTFGFSFTDQFVSAYDSFLTRTPSAYQLQTLTDTTFLSMTYDDLQNVYKSTVIGNLIGRLTAERLLLLKSKRELYLLNLTAEERYIKLFKERPQLLQVIPLKYISSYIGITAQALSRIRKRIS